MAGSSTVQEVLQPCCLLTCAQSNQQHNSIHARLVLHGGCHAENWQSTRQQHCIHVSAHVSADCHMVEAGAHREEWMSAHPYLLMPHRWKQALRERTGVAPHLLHLERDGRRIVGCHRRGNLCADGVRVRAGPPCAGMTFWLCRAASHMTTHHTATAVHGVGSP